MAAEPTVTISTRAAFDAINSMFSDGGPRQPLAAIPAAPAHVEAPAPAPPPPAACEPTVTINTMAAFEALNDMFNDDLPHNGRQRKVGAAVVVEGVVILGV
jgi:hypothetical protein